MASRGRGHRGRPRGAIQAPPVFDQQTFAEAVGIVAAAITQVAREVRVTSRGLGHIILRHSQGEEIRLWQTIGSCRLRKCWMLWRSPLIRPGLD